MIKRRLEYVLLCFAALLIIYGLIMPDNWAQTFGFFNKPIRWAEMHLPVVGNMARKSTIPDFIIGFFGVAVYIPPIFTFGFICDALFVIHSRNLSIYDVRNIMSDISKRELLYAQIWVIVGLLIIFFYYIFDPNIFIVENDWEYGLIMLALQSRVLMSILGSVVTIAVSILFAMTIGAMIFVVIYKDTETK